MSPYLYRLCEIFKSLQGEGRNTGRPVVFVRFANCNLKCAWCDTNHHERFIASLDVLLGKIEDLKEKSIILTGGEPTIQPELDKLIVALKERGYWIGIETNGIIKPPCADMIDYIAVSPKMEAMGRYMPNQMITKANEVRIVASSERIVNFCRWARKTITADDYYISPLSRHHKMNIATATKIMYALNPECQENPWKLSLQTHKLIGIK